MKAWGISMTRDDLKELVDVSKALLSWRDELERYLSEAYLCDEMHRPWISIVVDNHPTHLSKLTVDITRLEARAQIKEIMLAELKHKIRSLEAKLRHLKGK